MMDSELSPKDRKDLNKFIKFFALKTVQVIVQARLGEKICTRSSSSPTGSDWFTLAIRDIPEVTHETKNAMAGQLPSVGCSMCVEISLKTSEGDSMELETWCLEMNEKCEKDIKVSYTVYTRLSLLLKSLLAVTRVTPAYKLSYNQGHDYVILYRIYLGDVQLTGLGEGFQTVRVGVVGTPIGTLTLSCAYRTNLTFMSPREFERTATIIGLITDHFVERPLVNMAIKHLCNYRTPGDEEGGVYARVGDSCEVCTTSFSTSPPSQIAASGTESEVLQPLVQASHRTQEDYGCVLSCTSANTTLPPPSYCSRGPDALSRNGDVKRASPSDASKTTFTRKVGALVNRSTSEVTTASLDVPFAAFAPRSSDLEENDPMVHPPASPTPPSLPRDSLHSESSSQTEDQAQDEFVKPTFFMDNLMNLGTFYQEFRIPSQLTSSASSQSMVEFLNSLPEQLAIYEKKIDKFDAFVDSLQ